MAEKLSKKVSQCQKKLKGGPLVSPGIVCYAEKEEKPFWFSSLGQMIQYGTIKFRRTFKNYFGQFVWIRKKVAIIVAFYFMKRRLNEAKGVKQKRFVSAENRKREKKILIKVTVLKNF